jgi:hypothetical protein
MKEDGSNVGPMDWGIQKHYYVEIALKKGCIMQCAEGASRAHPSSVLTPQMKSFWRYR